MNEKEAAEIVAKYGEMSIPEVARLEFQEGREIFPDLLKAMSIVGDLVDNGDGTYSLPEET